MAAARASNVSSYIALGTENLKRRLYPKVAKGKLKKPFEPGKAEIAEISPEPVEQLEDDIKQTVLESLRQMVKSNGRESVEFFRGNYTPEDWSWLMDELRK